MRSTVTRVVCLAALASACWAQQPGASMSFVPSTIGLGGLSTFTFRLSNSTQQPFYQVNWGLTLTGGIVGTGNNAFSSCKYSSGGVTTVSPTEVRFHPFTLGPGETCVISMEVTSRTPGVITYADNSMSWLPTGLPPFYYPTVSATLAVVMPPVLSLFFAPSLGPPGGAATLSFRIGNPDNTYYFAPLTGVGVRDTLPAGMIIATPNGVTGSCGGAQILASPGADSIALVGATLDRGESCSFTVNVLAPPTSGRVTNSAFAYSSLGSGTAAEATFYVNEADFTGPISLTKAFTENGFGVVPHIGVGGTALLYYTLNNPNRGVLTDVSFTDVLPPGLRVGRAYRYAEFCRGFWNTSEDGTSVTFTSRSMPSLYCTLPLLVVGVAPGLQTSVSSPITSRETLPGAPAVASIHVGDPFQVSYFSNLQLGDSVINVTNPGTLGAGLAAGTSASTTGAICLNVYAFSPDEQMIACCSCPVTPNGLVSLSARQDLISKSNTPSVPNSIVVKLLASVPRGGSCQGSAASVSPLNLASSINAWGTKVHLLGDEGRVTETAFLPATLSSGELERLASLCTFLSAASEQGFGRCNACRVAGLGASATL